MTTIELSDSRLQFNAPPVSVEAAVELSVLMPCLNEAETLATCIEKAQRFLQTHGVSGEVIIADNGSTDGSQSIAEGLGARVVNIPAKGYGSALLGGIRAARGRYVIMGDADDSYDFSNLMPFVDKLREGHKLVMGNRFKGGIKPGAMPPLHRYLGNPVLTNIGRLFFKSASGDFHCGLRGFDREAILKLDLQTAGMEFASEMVVKATLQKLPMTEVPTALSPDGRSRAPHLRSWRDGWRHLRFLMLYSPRWLFLYPGMLLMVAGITAGVALVVGPVSLLGVTFDVHTLVFAALATIVGYQSVIFAFFTKIFAISEKLLPPDPRLAKVFSFVTLESGLLGGALLVLSGLGIAVYALVTWRSRGFGALNPAETLRVVIPAALLTEIGFQTVLASFFLSVLGLSRR